MADTVTARESSRSIRSFEWARALGAVCVVIIHAFVTTRQIPGADLASTRYVVQNVIDVVFTRWAVPVFLMISGALMLDPKREMGPRKIERHVWRMCFVLLTFGLAFALIESVVTSHAFGWLQVGQAILATLTGRTWDHMWYVYATLCLYLLTPVLRPFVATTDRRHLAILLSVFALLSLGSSTFTYLTGVPVSDWLGLSFPAIYYLWGYYAHTYLKLDRRVTVAGLGCLALMIGIAVAQDRPDIAYPDYLLVLPWSILVLLAFERFLERPLPKAVSLLASYSFGIYICHPLFQHVMAALFDLGSWPALGADVALVLVPLLASIALVWLLRHIKGFRSAI